MYIKKGIINNLGSFGLITAIIIFLIIILIGVVIDITSSFFTKVVLHDIVDSSLMNTASYIASSNILPSNEQVHFNLMSNLKVDLQGHFSASDTQDIIKNAEISIKKDSIIEQYSISVTPHYKMNISKFNILYWMKSDYKINIKTHSTIIARKGGINSDLINAVLVLDASESMNSTFSTNKGKNSKTKFDILKKSVENLLNQLDKNPILKKKSLIGAVTFNDKVKDILPVSFGTRNLKIKMKNLKAFGSTNSDPAMKKGYEMINNKPQTEEKYKQYLILMTDGANTSIGYNYNTIKTCKIAQEQGIEIFVVSLRKKKDDTNNQNFPEACASTNNEIPHIYYAINDNDMSNVFITIGQKISQKRHILLKR